MQIEDTLQFLTFCNKLSHHCKSKEAKNNFSISTSYQGRGNPENIKTTNAYISEKENQELKFALGETDNTHDLLIAQQKASTALQYTVALRDKFLESYKELMNMQI